jgi:hypothetical protein
VKFPDPPMWLILLAAALAGSGFFWLLVQFFRWAYRT